MRWRFALLLATVLAAFSALFVNLYHLQVREGPRYAARALAQYQSEGSLRARRGTIYLTDKYANRVAAAFNREYGSVFASPIDIDDPEEAAGQLAALFDADAGYLAGRLAREDDEYELIAEKVSEERIAQVRSAGIPGVYLDTTEQRFYPFGGMASHLLGFVAPTEDDDEARGRYGVEAYYDERLHGTSGFLEGSEVVAPRDGTDLLLTIDRNIQARSEEVLDELVEDFSISGGTVIVQEPETGKILALANRPSFNPNDYGRAPVASYLNPALQGVYEPGSVFKIFTMAAGIDSGSITPATTYRDTGTVHLNGRTIANWDGKAHGTVSMTEVIERSINTGAAFAENRTGHATFRSYLEQFGFGEPTGIALPGEVRGSLANLDEGAREINFATASFGQGVSVTPLQLVSAVSALANRGVLMRPVINQTTKPEVVRRVVRRETADAVTQMMVSAVEKAAVAAVSGYTVAGKTGTAQVPDFQSGGYSDEFIHTYVGFAPASNPRFTILIKADNPRGVILAGYTVVPAFRDLAEFIINYDTIPPDSISGGGGA